VRRRAALLVIGLLALPAAAGAAPPRENIVGGSQAAPGELPAQAAVQSGLGFCGGSLVTPNKVLSAAHCVFGEEGDPGDFTICLGQTNLNNCTAPDLYGVTSIDRNSSYNPVTAQNDVALLTLDRAAPFTPLQLVDPTHPGLWRAGTSARMIGWGTTSDGGDPSDDLLKADVPMVSDQACANDYAQPRSPGSTEQFDPATMVCAGDGQHDTCQGDSGGPLMVNEDGRLVLAGVTSFGEGCADPSFPGVYARVGADPLSSWLRQRGVTVDVFPPPPPPPADVTPPVLHLALPHGQRLRRALKNGLKLRFSCTEACKLTASLSIARKTAKRLHLKRTVAKRSQKLAPNVRTTVALKFSKAARQKLASARQVTLKLSVSVTDASGNPRKATRHILLRR
jgi:hypothetical protein